MNVYFVAYNYVNPIAWADLIQVLKVKEVFTFIPQTDFSNDVLTQFGDLIKLEKAAESSSELFCKYCVFQLNDKISKRIRIDSDQYDFIDLDSFPNSKWYDVKGNLNLQDENVMILAKMNRRDGKEWYNNHFVFDSIINDNGRFFFDAASNIANFLCNWSKKQNEGSDKYVERLCFFMIGRVNSAIYRDRSFISPRQIKEKYHVDFETRILDFIQAQLNALYPEKYPLDYYFRKGKEVLRLTFFNNGVIDEERKREREAYKGYCEELRNLQWLDVDNGQSWDDLGKEEMDYIVNNGGDWILD